MNSISIAYKNMKSNLSLYKLHFLALVFSVMAYYQFCAMKYNPEVLTVSEQEMVGSLGQVTAIFLIVFLIYFSWFSSSFFLQQRKKEIGLYTLMGVSNYKVALIYAMENLFMSILAIAGGCVVGALFGKFFMMILSSYCNLGADIEFFISGKAILETAAIFGIISLFFSIKGYINIIRSSLLSLINAMKKEESVPKASIITGILSIVVIGAGYYCTKLAMGVNFPLYILVTTILVIIGTYMLFRSTTTIILKRLINNKRILYRKTNIMTISNLCYRIRRNYKVYATIAILLTCTITALGTVMSLNYTNNSITDIDYPFSFTLMSQGQPKDKEIDEILNDKQIEMDYENQIEFLMIEEAKTKEFGYVCPTMIRYEDYKKVIDNVQYKFDDRILADKPLNDFEALFNQNSHTMFSLFTIKEMDIDGQKLSIRKMFRAPLYGVGIPLDAIIVNEDTYKAFEELGEKYYFHGYKFKDDTVFNKELETKMSALTDEGYTFFKNGKKDSQTKNNVIKVVYILGAFLALVFIMATGSIIYFKIITEAMEDKDKYAILSKIGMEDSTIRKVIRTQVAMAFILPLLVSIVHTVVAIKVLENLIGILLNTPIIISIALVSLIFFLYYIITVKKYLKLIRE
ncbi:ABC transporter permease [Vallitalea longa]|uniref:ABC transporter permease n=1 Tax=Vallitalea longa TaxID=2936439 RepID=A0A9W5Y999_9FIRM|nr:ABC transporter permease [Vallitalea longa]GKX28256.1 ABC transporter permease [Vallitalea longa]